MNIAALIEKNRIALLRLVFCWLAAAYCLTARGDKPLPHRLARFVCGLIAKAEKAAGYLLIAAHYTSQIKPRHNPAFEIAAMRRATSHAQITLGALTIAGIIKRLKMLQHMLHNLHKIARHLGKSIAARARVAALKLVVLVPHQRSVLPECLRILTREEAVPP